MAHTKIPWLEGVTDDRVAVVVAHQDDEAIAFCSVLMQCPRAHVIHVTDGAPIDHKEWKWCTTRTEYAALRQRELHAALDVIHHMGPRTGMGIVDSTASYNLEKIALCLAELFARSDTSLVFTHAYEGGHPDHDAIAFAVKVAARREHVRVIEAPFYRSRDNRTLWQNFEPHETANEIIVHLDADEQLAKCRMLSAHASQSGACCYISKEHEFLRLAPGYDFTKPPNGGRLGRNYERIGIDASGWRRRVLEACHAIKTA